MVAILFHLLTTPLPQEEQVKRNLYDPATLDYLVAREIISPSQRASYQRYVAKFGNPNTLNELIVIPGWDKATLLRLASLITISKAPSIAPSPPRGPPQFTYTIKGCKSDGEKAASQSTKQRRGKTKNPEDLLTTTTYHAYKWKIKKQLPGGWELHWQCYKPYKQRWDAPYEKGHLRYSNDEETLRTTIIGDFSLNQVGMGLATSPSQKLTHYTDFRKQKEPLKAKTTTYPNSGYRGVALTFAGEQWQTSLYIGHRPTYTTLWSPKKDEPHIRTLKRSGYPTKSQDLAHPACDSTTLGIVSTYEVSPTLQVTLHHSHCTYSVPFQIAKGDRITAYDHNSASFRWDRGDHSTLGEIARDSRGHYAFGLGQKFAYNENSTFSLTGRHYAEGYYTAYAPLKAKERTTIAVKWHYKRKGGSIIQKIRMPVDGFTRIASLRYQMSGRWKGERLLFNGNLSTEKAFDPSVSLYGAKHAHGRLSYTHIFILKRKVTKKEQRTIACYRCKLSYLYRFFSLDITVNCYFFHLLGTFLAHWLHRPSHGFLEVTGKFTLFIAAHWQLVFTYSKGLLLPTVRIEYRPDGHGYKPSTTIEKRDDDNLDDEERARREEEGLYDGERFGV